MSRKKKDAKLRRRAARSERKATRAEKKAARDAARMQRKQAAAEVAHLARVQAIRDQLRADGVELRMAAVRGAITDPAYVARLKAAIMGAEIEAPIRTHEQIRDIAMELLRAEWSADLAGVSLKVHWDPKTSKLGLRVVPDAAAVMLAAEKVGPPPAPRNPEARA